MSRSRSSGTIARADRSPLALFLVLAASAAFAAPAQPAPLPAIVVQTGNHGDVPFIAVSADGAYLVACSGLVAKLWHVPTGKELRTFEGHAAIVEGAAFSPDGRIVATASADRTARLWDAATGAPIRVLEGHGGFVKAVAFSPDGKLLLSAAWDRQIRVWDVASGTLVRTLSGHEGGIHAAVWSPDGTRILSGSFDKTIRLWDAATGAQRAVWTGHQGAVRSVAFSPDGRYALSGSDDRFMALWDVDAGKPVGATPELPAGVRSVAFSPDGTKALSGGDAMDGTLRVWDLAGGSDVLQLDCKTLAVPSVAFARDGKGAFASTDNKRVVLWNLATVAVEREFAGRCESLNDAVFSPGGRALAAASNDGTLKLWDLSQGRLASNLRGHEGYVQAAAFSPDGTKLVTASTDMTLKLWDAATGRELRAFAGHPRKNVEDVAFAPAGNTVLSAGWDGYARLWDVDTGAELRSFKHDNWVRAVDYSPDGARVLTASDDGTLALWNLADGTRARTFSGHSGGVLACAMSPDGARVLSGGADGTVRVWNAGSGAELARLPCGTTVWGVAWSPDGTRAAATAGKRLVMWDAITWKTVATFACDELASSVAFSPDGSKLVAAAGSVARLWDVADGSSASFTADADGSRWIAFTDKGYWDGSRDCAELVAMTRGLEVWNVDQFAPRDNRPDLVLAEIGTPDAALAKHFFERYKRRLDRMGVRGAAGGAGTRAPETRIAAATRDGRFVDLELSFAPAGAAVRRYNVWVNDVPLYGNAGKVLAADATAVARERVELSSGDNEIEASCTDESGAESWRAVTYERYDAVAKPDLYFVGFGVSTYRDPSLNLSWAARDILDLEARFKAMEGKGYGAVRSLALTDGNVTTQSIREAKNLLEGAKPDDVFVLAISGHGLHDTDAYATYYFLTHDADLRALSATAADFDFIEELLQDVAPRRKLFLMDTCESGEADGTTATAVAEAGGKGARPRTTKAPTLGKKAAAVTEALRDQGRYIYNDLVRRSGAIVFSSCRGGELSYEFDALQNGAFTEAVLEALSTKAADADGDGLVDTAELRAYVSSRVAELTKGLQHPVVDRDNLSARFGFPITP